MAKKKQKQSSRTNTVVLGLALLLIACIALGGMVGSAGAGGYVIAQAGYYLFGAGALLLPLALLTAGILLIRNKRLEVTTRQVLTGSLGLIGLLTFLSVQNTRYGGFVGTLVATPLIAGFDVIFASIILLVVIVSSFALFFDRTPELLPFFSSLWDRLRALFRRDTVEIDEEEPQPSAIDTEDEETSRPLSPPRPVELKVNDASAQEFTLDTKRRTSPIGSYTPPPLSLLEGDKGKANVGDVKQNANNIRRTLGNFGIEVEMDEITIGPTVTRYALKPAQGVKLSRIVALQNDLALTLAAHPLRIEAPIPGKSLVGVEIPNKTKATVGLASLLGDPAFTQARPLTVALGRNIAGKSVLRSIAKMPHLLIAGTTGSGKSVMLNAWISTLLFRTKPEEVRLILVDPKRVELSIYNGIPHLMTEVIVDSDKIIKALNWTVAEMKSRYEILAKAHARNLEAYNEMPNVEKKPYIVFVIDELADLMMHAPGDAEDLITKIAQMARAVGIHLVLATQRPSVDVITGLMKANIPTRVAFNVSSLVDSRVVIDTPGAEKLLGRGDMLYLPPDQAKPRRIQGPFVTEKEVQELVTFLRNQNPVVHYTQEITEQAGPSHVGGRGAISGSGGGNQDPFFNQALDLINQTDKASASLLQRKLNVGYARAARILDQLQEAGYVGPAEGSKPREILRRGAPSQDTQPLE